QGGLTPLGTAFVGVVFAATAVVALSMGWTRLLVAGALASAPQIAALVLRPEYDGRSPGWIVVLAAAFSLLYAVAGAAHHLRAAGERIGQIASSLVGGGVFLAALAAVRLFPTEREEGLALLAVAAAYGVAAAFLFTRPAARTLSALLAAVAFVAGGFALADV